MPSAGSMARMPAEAQVKKAERVGLRREAGLRRATLGQVGLFSEHRLDALRDVVSEPVSSRTELNFGGTGTSARSRPPRSSVDRNVSYTYNAASCRVGGSTVPPCHLPPI